jgi:2-polyprenyl-6-methoxyphenol hydroxylase-like FAD-dependent oxidoreductase
VADRETAVCVLGADISGITTALVLHLLDWQVRVVADQVMAEDSPTLLRRLAIDAV